MRIDRVQIKNFRCFADQEFQFHPHFNLLVGMNGSGKTSILDALSIAQATWLIGLRNKLDNRSIQTGEARLILRNGADEKRYVEQYPVEIAAWGHVMGQSVHWVRSKDSETGKTRYGQASQLINLAKQADECVRLGKETTLPLISYYGTMRLWQEPKDFQKLSRVNKPEHLSNPHKLSYFEGYRLSVDPRISIAAQVAWFARQAWITFQEGEDTWAFKLLKEILIGCIEGAEHIAFDPRRGELMLKINGQDPQPFVNLSDGQKTILAMVADMAQKAIWLNPHLGEQVLQLTPGLVLIDELDLHLHPQWQRRVIADLRRIFPQIQFICTTHSPQLIGQVKADEIILLPTFGLEKSSSSPTEHTYPSFAHPAQSYGMDSNWVLQHIMGSTDRDPDVSIQLDRLFEAIENADFESATALIETVRQEIGEHPELVEAEALISRYTRFAHLEDA
jgi:predicted ATP-binding protein involved in virulence